MREEVTEAWTKCHSEELHYLFSSPNIRVVKKKNNQIGRACGIYGREERCIHGFGGETSG
jgi:hypothetical protein